VDSKYLSIEHNHKFFVRLAANEDADIVNEGTVLHLWATRALLFSLFEEGMSSNSVARSFLRHLFINALLREQISLTEDDVCSLAEFSPCNEPSQRLLDNLGCIDQLWKRGQQIRVSSNDYLNKDNVDLWLTEALRLLQRHRQFSTTQERVIHAPMARYALDPQSTTTPEKQCLHAQGVSVHQGMAIFDGTKACQAHTTFVEALKSCNHCMTPTTACIMKASGTFAALCVCARTPACITKASGAFALQQQVPSYIQIGNSLLSSHKFGWLTIALSNKFDSRPCSTISVGPSIEVASAGKDVATCNTVPPKADMASKCQATEADVA